MKRNLMIIQIRVNSTDLKGLDYQKVWPNDIIYGVYRTLRPFELGPRKEIANWRPKP